MRTPASIANHPIHPMIVPVAIGGFVLSFAFDIVCVVTGDIDAWARPALFTMIGGIAAAVIAAFFGFADFWSLRDAHVRKMAAAHMALNLTIVALYVWNAALRIADPASIGLPFALSLAAVAMLVASGWIGGAMVYEHGVGVDVGHAAETRDAAASAARPRASGTSSVSS